MTLMSFIRKIMNILEFKNHMAHYPVFSLQELKKVFKDFSYRQLDRWEKKGYLKKVKRGFYVLSERQMDQNLLFYTANKIYPPSYVSLQTALKFYGLIPEEIFQVTSVTTKKTTHFEAGMGNFIYGHLKASLYWGYIFVDYGIQKILMAEPEKAILDYLYLNPHLKTRDDFAEMRINVDEFRARVSEEKFNHYLKNFESESLTKRAQLFLKTMQHDFT